MNRLEGKTAIVTGAAQGIGAVYAKALSREGARVVIADILDGAPMAREIEAAGGKAISVTTNVADTASVNAMIEKSASTFGGIDILVNNAAIFASLSMKPITAITDEEWDAVMQVNVAGLFKCTRAVLPHMRKRGGGKIINISSGTVIMGSPMLLHYVTSKAAVAGFTRALARELGPDKICVNSLAPGFTLSEGVKSSQNFPSALHQMIEAGRCFQRGQQPEDLVGGLLFLASSESDFVTGQMLLIDGGNALH